jgi:hypothetical protein
MDEAQVKALIDTAIATGLKSGLASFQAHYTKQIEELVAPIAARLDEFEVITEQEKQPAAAEPKDSPEVRALMKRLEDMENRDRAREEELKSSRLSQALSKHIGGRSPLHAEAVTELLSKRVDKAVEKDGEWYLPSGLKLSEEVDNFFNSPVGLHFTANPVKGSTSDAGGTRATGGTKKDPKDVTLDDMLADFSF